MIDLRGVRDVMRANTFAEEQVQGEVFLAARVLDDMAMAIGGEAKPVSTRGALYAYDGSTGTWREIRNEEALSIIQAYDGCMVKYYRKRNNEWGEHERPLRLGATKCKNILSCALSNPDALDLEFFDHQMHGLAFPNGFATADKEGVIFAGKSPLHRAISCMPFDYNPDATAPEWEVVLDRVFDGDPDADDKRLLLQEFVGACVTGIAINYASCLVLIGEGANGKSVIAETIAEQLFPSDAVTYTTPQSWGGRFTLSQLRNSRLNVATELPAAEIQASDVFKDVVDGGTRDVEEKNKPAYSMRFRAGHLFLTNAPPSTSDNSHGFWRRFLAIEFNRDFSRDPHVETKSVIKERLQREAAGIMNWALSGAVRLLRQGQYTRPESHQRLMGDWRLDADQVAAFVDECCARDGMAPLTEIFDAFKQWCEKAGRRTVSNRTLARRLRSLGVHDTHTRDGAMFDVSILPKPEWASGKKFRVVNGSSVTL